jgi:hypothetical protein
MKMLVMVACAAALAACAHSTAAPRNEVEEWRASNPAAAQQLCVWNRNHPAASQRLSEWLADHPVEGRNLIDWAATHPQPWSAQSIRQANPAWGVDPVFADPAVRALLDWARNNPGPALDLSAAPHGLERAIDLRNC